MHAVQKTEKHVLDVKWGSKYKRSEVTAGILSQYHAANKSIDITLISVFKKFWAIESMGMKNGTVCL